MNLDRVDARDLLEALGIKITSVSGDNLVFACPWHFDRHPSARMNFKTTLWLCDVCHIKGNAIHFLSRLRSMSYEEALGHISMRYGIGPTAAIDDLEREVRRNLDHHVEAQQERVLPSEEELQSFFIPWEVAQQHPAYLYMVEQRGFSPAVLTSWEIGYDSYTNRITIPVRDAAGQLVGFKARALDPDKHPRYLILGTPLGGRGRFNFHTYAKSEHVFGLHRCQSRSLVVVEGELNAIAMHERHGCEAVAVAGSEFSDRQRELIARACDHVIVYLDDDLAGRRGTIKVAQSLMPFVQVDVVLSAPGDAAELGPYDVRELLSHAESALTLAVRRDLDLVVST